jgi:hypothetical protein
VKKLIYALLVNLFCICRLQADSVLYDDFTDGNYTSNPVWVSKTTNSNWSVTGGHALLSGTGSGGNGILISHLSSNTNSVSAILTPGYETGASGFGLILATGDHSDWSDFVGYEVYLSQYLGAGGACHAPTPYHIGGIVKTGGASSWSPLGVICGTADFDWSLSPHTITLGVSGGMVSLDIDSSAYTLSVADGDYTEFSYISAFGIPGNADTMSLDNIYISSGGGEAPAESNGIDIHVTVANDLEEEVPFNGPFK